MNGTPTWWPSRRRRPADSARTCGWSSPSWASRYARPAQPTPAPALFSISHRTHSAHIRACVRVCVCVLVCDRQFAVCMKFGWRLFMVVPPTPVIWGWTLSAVLLLIWVALRFGMAPTLQYAPRPPPPLPKARSSNHQPTHLHFFPPPLLQEWQEEESLASDWHEPVVCGMWPFFLSFMYLGKVAADVSSSSIVLCVCRLRCCRWCG